MKKIMLLAAKGLYLVILVLCFLASIVFFFFGGDMHIHAMGIPIIIRAPFTLVVVIFVAVRIRWTFEEFLEIYDGYGPSEDIDKQVEDTPWHMS